MKNLKSAFFLFGATLSQLQGDESTTSKTIFMAGQPVSLISDQCCGIGAKGDLLVWQPHQAGLDYIVIDDNKGTISAAGNNNTPNLSWGYGFRIGINGICQKSGIGLDLDWTRFYNTSSNSVTPTPSQQAIPLCLSDLVPADDIDFASSNFSFHLDLIDLKLFQGFYINEYMTISPTIGVSGLILNEKNSIYYEGGDLWSNDNPINITFINHFWGVGLVPELVVRWILPQNFSLFSDMRLALLSGQLHLNSLEQGGRANTIINNFSDSYKTTKLLNNFSLGLSWNRPFYQDKCNIELHVAWEQLFLSNIWQWQSAGYETRPNGDLDIFGVTVGGQLTF